MDLKAGDGRVLEPGIAFHLVPLLHIPRVGAMGMSETVLVTDGGCEVLTQVDRGLLACPG